ncbi:MAG: nucleotidyltransferase domain-containing protein [Nitrospirae bacterium]|nr:nucleotidyltransferase domain-containing protein [Nitrospirota bacterium]
MDDRDKSMVLEFRRRLPSDLQSHLTRLIVFGSRARGEAKEDSDLDIIALVDVKTPEIERHLEDIVYQVMWDHDFKPVISLKVITDSQFTDALKRGFSFYKHVVREGVSV